MSNKFPLQPGDRVQTSSSWSDSSTSADRRPTRNDGLDNQPGENVAPGHESPNMDAPLWKVGQVHPHCVAPFPVVHTQGDTSGEGTQEHEINIYEYGDCYDPTAPMRTRDVGSEWHVDTDFDGSKN